MSVIMGIVRFIAIAIAIASPVKASRPVPNRDLSSILQANDNRSLPLILPLHRNPLQVPLQPLLLIFAPTPSLLEPLSPPDHVPVPLLQPELSIATFHGFARKVLDIVLLDRSAEDFAHTAGVELAGCADTFTIDRLKGAVEAHCHVGVLLHFRFDDLFIAVFADSEVWD